MTAARPDPAIYVVDSCLVLSEIEERRVYVEDSDGLRVRDLLIRPPGAADWVTPQEYLSVRPDPKPRPRIRATSSQWKAIHARKRLGRPCRLCGAPATNLHHIVPRSQGGDDVEANLVEVCGSGTTGCHGRIEARDADARSALRAQFSSDEIGYVLDRKGAAWLDGAYPLPAIRCAS